MWTRNYLNRSYYGTADFDPGFGYDYVPTELDVLRQEVDSLRKERRDLLEELAKRPPLDDVEKVKEDALCELFEIPNATNKYASLEIIYREYPGETSEHILVTHQAISPILKLETNERFDKKDKYYNEFANVIRRALRPKNGLSKF